MAWNQNAAYDLSHFAPVKPAERPQIRVAEKKKVRKKPKFKAGLLAAAAVLVALVCMVVYNKMMLMEAVSATNRAASKLAELESQEGRLEVELESLVSLRQADDYAVNELGLVKTDNACVTYVNLYSDSVIVRSDQPHSIFSLLTVRLETLKDYFE